jgi:hypothetical protein
MRRATRTDSTYCNAAASMHLYIDRTNNGRGIENVTWTGLARELGIVVDANDSQENMNDSSMGMDI